MMRSRAGVPAPALLIAGLLIAGWLAGPVAFVAAIDPPTITVTYESAQGIEENDEEELSPSYVRRTVVTTVRQPLGGGARVTLPVRLTTRSDPREPAHGNDRSVSIQPRLDVDLTDRLDLGTELILRHSDDRRLVTAGGRLQSRLRVGDIAIDGWLKPLFDLYADQPERNRQLYTASVGVTYARDALRVSTRYRGTARFAFGDESEVDPRFSLLVSVSLRLDLAAVR